MFIKNTLEHDIPNDGTGITCGGYSFIIPAGKVCAIWDEAGKLITEQLYKLESKTGIDERTMRPDSAPVPPVVVVDRSEWDGKTYATVSRFRIIENAKRIANGDVSNLLKLAEERGVSEEKLRKFRFNASTEPEEIAREIDSLPIPDEVRYPEKVEKNDGE